MRSVETAAPSLGVQAIAVPIRATAEIEPAVASFARQPNGGLILPTDTFIRLRQKQIADLAARHRLPAIGAEGDFANDGGLMYYSASNNVPDQMRRAAGYVDRILKGAKPADLPIQAGGQVKLVINLKTAKALGILAARPLGSRRRGDRVKRREFITGSEVRRCRGRLRRARSMRTAA